MESFIREIRAWLAFYNHGSLEAKTEKDCASNAGIVDGIKLTLETMEKHKLISKEDKQKIY